MDAVRGPRHPALLRRRVHRPDVEVGLALLEGRDGEQDVRQALRVGVPLPHLGRGVAVAEEQQVHLVARRAVLQDGPRLAGGRAGAVDAGSLRVHGHRPGLAEEALGVALLQDDLHRALRLREAQRLVEGAVGALRLVGRLPLPADAGEATRVHDAVRGAVDHLEEVLAEVRVVDRPVGVAGPRALEHEAVEGEALLGGARGVEVVEPERGWRPGVGRGGGER